MLCAISNRCQWSLFLIRIMLGVIFTAHGLQKVLGLFGGPGLEGFAQWSATFGIPHWLAYLAAFSELIGGLLLLSGFAAQIGALLVIGVMIGAIVLVHLKNGFFIQNNGFEYPLSLIISALAIILGGPGTLSSKGCCPASCKCNQK